MNRWLTQPKTTVRWSCMPTARVKYIWSTPSPREDENKPEPRRARWDGKRCCCHRGKPGSVSDWILECLHCDEVNLRGGASQQERERSVHMEPSVATAALLYRKTSLGTTHADQQSGNRWGVHTGQRPQQRRTTHKHCAWLSLLDMLRKRKGT